MADSDDSSSRWQSTWWIILLLIILLILLLSCCIGFLIWWFCLGGAGDKDDKEEDVEGGMAINQNLVHTKTINEASWVAMSPRGGHGIPKNCIDYGMKGGKLVMLDGVGLEQGDWRMSGTPIPRLGYGFELTQDEDNQEGHLMCRVPFEAKGSELHASLEYSMKPKSASEGGGQGLCVYLVDPSIAGWDRHFDGTGPLGFVGKKGAIVGVGIDCTGEFCEGKPASIAVKRASDGKLLCDPVPLKGGVATRENEWREVKIKFDIEENKIDVTIGGKKVLDDIKFQGIRIPKQVCIAVCAGTQGGKTNKMCVNKLKVKGEK